jgi:ElaB/YqjD/DUF883 family membrane-anchored ribosome-binding protein
MTTSSTATSSNLSGMADRAQQALDRAADKVSPTLDRVRDRAHTTVDKVAETAATGVDWAQQSGRQLARKGGEYGDMASDYVRERPLVAMAGALALGYLIGRMLR